MAGTRLSEIPGVGAKTAEKLIEYFGGEEEALRAIMQCRLRLLVEAVGAAAATRILHGYHRARWGRWPREVAATEDAWRLYTGARTLIEKRVASKAGVDVLSCMLPLPSSAVEEVWRRQSLVREAGRVAERLGEKGLRELRRLLNSIDWPRPVRVGRLRRTLVALGVSDAECRAIRERVGRLVEVVCTEDPSEAERLAERGEVLVYDPGGLYTGSLPKVEYPEPELVAPEAVVEYFRVNWRVALSALKAVELLGDHLRGWLAAVGVEVDVDKLLAAREAVEALKGGDINPEVDEEYGRLRRALDSLDRVVDEVELWVNNEMQSRLESLEVRLTAAQFLKLLSLLREGSAGEAVDLPEEIYEAYEEIAEEAEKRIAEKLGLTPDEAELVKGIVPRTPTFPVSLDRDRVAELRSLLAAKLEARRFQLLQEIAEKLRGVREDLEKLVYALALLDVALAEYSLVSEGAATIPEVSRDYLGVGVINGLEAGLVGRRGAQPVSYAVGVTPYRPDDTKGERVILLTGANSGGKTTLLKLLCETTLLAQSGLVVFAEKAWIGAFDSVHFFSKPTGMVDAGALETTLRTLAAIASTRAERRLILVDELEAATEAGAASRIMAVVIETLCRDQNVVAVIVTHLAREILAALGEPPAGCLRIDGIEAKGLDENYNLIVDRNPRYYHLARSTPELVVRRLLHRSKSRAEKEFYKRLLEALASSA